MCDYFLGEGGNDYEARETRLPIVEDHRSHLQDLSNGGLGVTENIGGCFRLY